MLKTGSKGFTIIELVMLISIMGIMAFVLVTNSPLGPARLTAAREKLINDLRYVQSLAYSQGGSFRIDFSPENDNYTVFSLLSGAPVQIIDPVDSSSQYIIDYTTDEAFRGVDLVSASFDGTSTLVFDWEGAPSTLAAPLNAEGTIVLQNSSGLVTVRVNPETGRISY